MATPKVEQAVMTPPLGLLSDAENTLPTVALATAILIVFGFFFRKSISGPRKILPLDDFINVPLIKKEVLSHDTCRFTFGLPDPQAVLGLPIGQHLTLKFYDNDGKAVQRSYTPVTDDRSIGQFSLVVKVYKSGINPKFPNGGKMSQHLDDLRIGEIIQIKGPKGHVHFDSNGNNANCGQFSVKPLGKPLEQRSCHNIGMMAGGTGITPMLQILHAIFDNPITSKQNSHMSVKLIYANQTPDDILVRDELEALAERFPDRFQLHYTVDRVDGSDDSKNNWKGGVGFINTQMVEDHLLFNGAKAGDGSTQFFMCGPPPMLKFACIPALEACGYTPKDWVAM